MQQHTSSRARIGMFGAACFALTLFAAGSASAGTLERIKETGKVTLGYRGDAAPFSYRDDGGKPAGYAVTLCQRIVDGMKTNLGVANLTVDWTPVAAGSGLAAVQNGSVDLLCTAGGVTQSSRRDVEFSIPIFPGGVAGVLRTDAPERLQYVLEERPPPYQPLWRGSNPQALEKKTFSAITGTSAAEVLSSGLKKLGIAATVVLVRTMQEGIAGVTAHNTDVFFADRAALLDAVGHSAAAQDLRVLSRHFTYQPIALALPRGDDDFRLYVDTALSGIYLSPAFGDLYAADFGKPDADTVAFFRMVIVPK